MIRLHTLSTIDRRKVLKFAATQIEMSTITPVLTVLPITKSVTRKKSGLVAHFIQSGSMKVVFMNYN